jgi:hypothetical protein
MVKKPAGAIFGVKKVRVYGQLALETPQTAASTTLGLNPVTVAAPNTVNRPPVNPVTVTPPTVTPPTNGSSQTPAAPQAAQATPTTPQASSTPVSSNPVSSPTISAPPIGTTTPAPVSSNPSPAPVSSQPIALPAPVNTLPSAVSSAVNPTSTQSPSSSSLPIVNPITITAPNQVTPPITGTNSASSVTAPVGSVPVSSPNTVKPPVGTVVPSKPIHFVGGQLRLGALSFWVDDLYFVDDDTEKELTTDELRKAFIELIKRQDGAMGRIRDGIKAQLASIFGRFNARTAKRELDRLGPGTFGGRTAFVSVQIINNATSGDKDLSPDERLRYNLALNLLILNGDARGMVNYLDYAAGLVKDNNARTGPVQDLWDRLIRYSYTGEWRLPKLDNLTAAARYFDRKNLSGWVAPAMMEAGLWVGTRIGDAFKGRVSRIGKPSGCNSFAADTKVSTNKGFKRIADVRIGDMVKSFDEKSKQEGFKRVSAVMQHKDNQITKLKLLDFDGKQEVIETTPWHKFAGLSRRAPWITPEEMIAGKTLLRQSKGRFGYPLEVKTVAREQVMYDLTVEDFHTFMVGDNEWIVHNTNEACELANKANEALQQLPENLRGVTIAVSKDVNGRLVVAVFGTTAEITSQAVATLKNNNWTVFSAPSIRTTDFHAERQLERAGFTVIGISRAGGMCPDCKNYFADKPNVIVQPYVPPKK